MNAVTVAGDKTHQWMGVGKICEGSGNPPESICLDYTWYANPRGICPFCRDDFAVLGDGTLRSHNADRGRVITR